MLYNIYFSIFLTEFYKPNMFIYISSLYLTIHCLINTPILTYFFKLEENDYKLSSARYCETSLDLYHILYTFNSVYTD